MEVINKLIQSDEVNEFISKIQPVELQGDFRSHLYLTLVDYDQDKILKAYREKYLGKLVGRIILNQFKSKTSPFWVIYRNQGFRYYQVSFIEIPKNDIRIEEEDDFDRELWMKEKIKEIDNLLRAREGYHSFLFRLYYFDNKTYQEIEELTGINFQSVRTSVIKTKDWIKNRIKE